MGSLAPQTGSTTGQRTLMGNPVWIGLEAGIRCAARQCSKVWLFLKDHLRSRTFALHLPCPDPVNKVAHHFLRPLRAMLEFDFSPGFTWMRGICSVPPQCSTPPREVHVTDQLHLHLHHMPHPASFRRAHAGHAKVRDPAPGGEVCGEVGALPARLVVKESQVERLVRNQLRPAEASRSTCFLSPVWGPVFPLDLRPLLIQSHYRDGTGPPHSCLFHWPWKILRSVLNQPKLTLP